MRAFGTQGHGAHDAMPADLIAAILEDRPVIDVYEGAHLRRPTLRAGVHPYWPAGRHPPVLEPCVTLGATAVVPNLHGPAHADLARCTRGQRRVRRCILPAVGNGCRPGWLPAGLRLSGHSNRRGPASPASRPGSPTGARSPLPSQPLSSRQRDEHHLLQRRLAVRAQRKPSPSCSSDASVTARRARFQSTQRSASRKGRPRRRQWARMDSIQGR